ncbi:unnamed protein product [Trichogramma brassicae]|uniref:Uncharacterized protein n=1 Tax=Trichogramma brassicae TaxID=86971 RepID=A0A6H5J5D0_9HYME|nr:unnamed protein product [Trichogramma brassicae]
MEEILALPSVNGPDEVLDILNKISNTRLADEKFSHKVEEYESKIGEISKEVKALKNAVDSEQQVLDSKIAEFEDYNNLLELLSMTLKLWVKIMSKLELQYLILIKSIN